MARPTKSYASVISGAALIVTLSALAAFAADAENGKKFAGRACLVCHAVSSSQTSSDPDAPPFAAVARSKQFRAKGAKLLLEAHPKMPNFALTGDEAADAAAYIRSLKK